jgi:hypothetical protein
VSSFSKFHDGIHTCMKLIFSEPFLWRLYNVFETEFFNHWIGFLIIDRFFQAFEVLFGVIVFTLVLETTQILQYLISHVVTLRVLVFSLVFMPWSVPLLHWAELRG